MGAEPDSGDEGTIRCLILAHGSVGPTRDEERFAIRMEENPIRPSAGFYALDHHARLRINDGKRIVIKIGRVDQAAVRGDGDIANKIAIGALVVRNDGKSAGGL